MQRHITHVTSIVFLLGLLLVLTGFMVTEYLASANDPTVIKWSIRSGSIIVAAFIWYVAVARSIRPVEVALSHLLEGISASPGPVSRKTGRDDVLKLDSIARDMQEKDAQLRHMSDEVMEKKRLATLGQLAAGVAHEMNNPLTGIFVYSHLLLEDTDTNDPRADNIRKIIRESERCKYIIKSLLDFARQSTPNLMPVRIGSILDESIKNLQHDTLFDHIDIGLDGDNNLPETLVDSSQIQEVFENIIRNAAEIMEGVGRIAITRQMVRGEDGRPMIEIAFRDTGPGIPPDHLDMIFDPFFTTKTKGHGTGLGLAVCYGIIERHRGTISGMNVNGSGAVFSVRLPVERGAS